MRQPMMAPFFFIFLFLFPPTNFSPLSIFANAQQQQQPRFGSAAQQQQQTTAGAVMPRARGPASNNLAVKHGRANYQGQLQTNSTPLVLWCHAVDARLLDVRRGGGASDPPVLVAEEIYFTHNGQKHMANLSMDHYNGTLIIDPVLIGHAGQWTCHIRTRDYGSVNGEITVYLRPVVYSTTLLRIEEVQGDKFRFEASGVTVLRKEQARMECPVYGYPKPDIIWRKGAHDVMTDDRIRIENGTLIINNASYEDEDTYTCKAFNSFTKRSSSGDKRLQSSVSIERRLRVKNELGWLLPLCIILLTVILLVLIIVLCEMRKRRKEQKQLLGNTNNNNEEE